MFRRSTTLIVVAGEFFMFQKLPSKACLVSLHSYMPLAAHYQDAALCLCLSYWQHDNRVRFASHKPGECMPSKGLLIRLLLLLQGSIVVMLIGAVIAGATDLTYSLPGYIWVVICAVSTAMYLLLIRALKDSTGLSLYCSSCACSWHTHTNWHSLNHT